MQVEFLKVSLSLLSSFSLMPCHLGDSRLFGGFPGERGRLLVGEFNIPTTIAADR